MFKYFIRAVTVDGLTIGAIYKGRFYGSDRAALEPGIVLVCIWFFLS